MKTKLKTNLLLLSLAASCFGHAQQPSVQEPPVIQDPAQLVGKKINVNRLPLCELGTYKLDFSHAGMEATVISAKPSRAVALSKSVLDKMSPDMREIILDQQNASLLLLQFDDGAKRDTCAAIGPKKLAEYVDLSPGQSLEPVAPSQKPANLLTFLPATPHTAELSEEEVNSALSGLGRDHWIRIEDMGLMAAQGAQVPSIILFSPEALLAIRSDSAKKQFIKYEPTHEDRQRALTVVAEGFVSKNVQGGCDSITRVVLLSDPSGNFVKEAYLSEPLEETWRNAYGAGNYCQALQVKFSLEDVEQVRAAAQDHEFYIAVFSGTTKGKMYRIKHKHQSKLGLK